MDETGKRPAVRQLTLRDRATGPAFQENTMAFYLDPNEKEAPQNRCLYCKHDLPDEYRVPRRPDDPAWLELANDHAKDCEWIVSRAHTLPSAEWKATLAATPCSHNEMVATGNADLAWKCAKCGYIYGSDPAPSKPTLTLAKTPGTITPDWAARFCRGILGARAPIVGPLEAASDKDVYEREFELRKILDKDKTPAQRLEADRLVQEIRRRHQNAPR